MGSSSEEKIAECDVACVVLRQRDAIGGTGLVTLTWRDAIGGQAALRASWRDGQNEVALADWKREKAPLTWQLPIG
ncbi:hypothetical protein Syun_004196 [Stephania yunnanensis]|uniref:Uncharacterized protein n=1 Tax=Stephania yunnanensis TaxID=152371 RepID=A0AAP0L5W1_9MAGN